ncbi:hypothetical protein KKP88_00460 [Methanothermococcus sp. SCGC AD-155-K20]|nr:hypothetical protein [Methanothermococcus sp. SCGC AD-155-K20]
MAGITNGDFCKKYRDLFGIVTIGAYNLDNTTLSASKEIAKRGRREFLHDISKLREVIKREIIEGKKSNSLVSVNIRFKDFNEAEDTIKLIDKYGDIIEINCHCRQSEITKLGLGQELLKNENNHILKDFLKGIIELDLRIPVFLKIRANFIPVDELIYNLNKVRKYFDGLHVDCFNPGRDYPDLNYLEKIRENFKEKIIVGNNSIKSIGDGKNMLKYSDMISVARCVLSNNIHWIPKFNKYILNKEVK